MKEYSVIGCMSGTSLDGVDLAHCIIREDNGKYGFRLGVCETIPYPAAWLERLKNLSAATALYYAETHTAYGRYLGSLANNFIKKHSLQIDFVASHGHTIFHQPQAGFTAQIGEGAALAAAVGLPVVCDFRTTDVAHGGQGAPLVPIGDLLLFADYDYCLNLGGFSNISMQKNDKRIAFDISPCNIVLNALAEMEGKSFDKDGLLAASGKVDAELLEKLNALQYYHTQPPKSLGREWVEQTITPLLSTSVLSTTDKLATFCEHIAIQITEILSNSNSHKLLVTGGGALNKYLVGRIQAHTRVKLFIPEQKIINFKEALIFGFLGVLRIEQISNCLSSVTGAKKNSCGGCIYLP